MELSVTQENLSRALNLVGRVASGRTGLPILNNILLRTEGNRLLVAATNLEVAVTCFVGAKITKKGSITLPARLVTEFVSSLPKDIVNLSVKGTKIEISSSNNKSSINGIGAEDFPELPTIEEKDSVHYQISADDFKQAVNQTIIASSGDTARPVLTGVYWHSVDGFLYLASTDGYRLAERRLMATKSQIKAIVPVSSLQEALRAIYDGVSEVEVVFDDNQVRFRIGEAEITSRLIDGNYPDYRQLIPTSAETVVEIPANEFTKSIKISSLFARESGGGITLSADSANNQLSIYSIASELGENTSTTEAKVSADGQITLNSRYIIDALGAIDGDDVEFRFNGKLAPAILQDKSKDVNYIHLIMPLKS